MQPLTYDELAARVREYEFWLVRIADKPREYQALVKHFGRKPDAESAEGAYNKCGTLAWVALRRFHPGLTEEIVHAHDSAERACRDGDYYYPLPDVPAAPQLADLCGRLRPGAGEPA